jgi:hypothetical protein
LNDYLKHYYENSPWKDSVFCWYPFELGVKYEIIIDPPDFSVEALAAYRKNLGPRGKLLLAFENPFGLRYWNGKSSPVTGLPYDSLLGRDNRPSKAEVELRLKQAGFEGQKWYYPTTDHWFTRDVYSDNYLPNEFLNQRFAHYMEYDRFLQFDERMLYYEVIRGGAFTFMCGAYFVEARCRYEDAACVVDYAAVTSYREPAKRFATTVRSDGTVRKTPLCSEGLESVQRTSRIHGELASLGVNVLPVRMEYGTLVMTRVELPTLWDYWAKKLKENTLDFNDLAGGFDCIRDTIYKSAAKGTCYWELVPANCFYDEKTKQFLFFDQEYCWDSTPPEIALVRALWALKYSAFFAADPRTEGWLEALKARYGLVSRWDELTPLAEAKAFKEVFGDGSELLERDTAIAIDKIIETENERKWRHKQAESFLPAARKIRAMGYYNPVIYGYGYWGKDMKHVLYSSGVWPVRVLDQKLPSSREISHLPPEAGCDVIIVSIKGGADIAEDLKTKTRLPVYTLEELLDE